MDKALNDTQIKEHKICCRTRDVLWYLVFFGFAVNYMIRINLNIAIVSMVKARSQNNQTLTSECLVKETQNILSNFTDNYHENSTNLLSTFGDDAIRQEINTTQTDVESSKFPWDEKQQSTILGAFFWLHWVTQVPGGILASKYGTKRVFGFGNFLGVFCCLFIPMAAHMGHIYLILIRVIQGLLCGFCWPAMHNMTARWIPPNERSKFVTAYLGSSVGAALTYPICGFIIDKWGWELVFYTSCALGTLWFTAWWLLVYDSPTQHPRISDNERDYILNSIGQTYTKEKAPVPWKHLMTSIPVWMNILAQWGGIWGLFTLMTHTPTYFKFIHGLNIKTTGLLSGMPHVLRMLWSYIFGQISDYLLRTNKMTRTNVRKLATTSCTIGESIFMLALAYSGCNSLLAVIFLSISVALNGSVSAGPLACIVDISPNYASIILGLVNSAVAIVGFLTPVVVGYLTFENQTVQQWQKVFWIGTFISMSSGILYLSFAKAELQPWNSPNFHEKQHESEMISMSQKVKSRRNDDGKVENQKV